jgi:CubicO group peptidase (beta-lactamase class C family)
VTHRIVLALVFALVGVVGSRSADAEPLAKQPEVAAALHVLDAWVAAAVASREVPGLAIAIVHDQDVIWAKGYGFADVERKVAVTPATLFRIASVSKTFTATAIMQLRDAGKLKLDEPLTTYLPWFAFQIEDLQIMILNGQLTMVSPGSDTPWSDRVVLRPVGANLFRMQGGWAAGELAKFELDAQGRVTRLVAGNIYWTRK